MMTTYDYEAARSSLEALTEEFEGEDRNEATTRAQLIDRLVFDCLAWARQDVTMEESHDGKYADYTFRHPRKILIIEAKREGKYFTLPAGHTNIEYSLSSLSRDNDDIKKALRQGADYCQRRGVPYGAVCNGHQIIAFIASREDGRAPLEGDGLVFPSLEFMRENFQDLWDALSKPGIEEGYLKQRLLSGQQAALPPKISATLSRYPGKKNRNVVQTDLRILSEVVIEDVAKTREIEPRFLRECYCKSGALSQHALLSKKLLKQRYSALFGDDVDSPTTVPAQEKSGISQDLLAASLSRRPVILLGDKGVGKTTFIRNLVHVEAAEQFEDAIQFYVDFGTQASLSDDLSQFVVDELTEQLWDDHDVDIQARNFVRGVYNQELERFRGGIYSDLAEEDPKEFKKKEIEFLEEKLDDQAKHLKASLDHISKGRKKQIVLFLDNSDQRTYETQQQVFLIAQEIAEHWPATVFVSLRPETFHRSVKQGTLDAYHAKAFTIDPPRIDRVIEKRLEFALKITSGEIELGALPEGTSVRLDTLEYVMRAFLYSLHKNDVLVECIDNIAAGNVRLALDLVRKFFGSGHVDTQEISEIYRDTGRYLVPLHQFLQAIIFGDGVFYNPAESPIVNVFDISRPDGREHFLLLGLLSGIASKSDPGSEAGFVPRSEVYDLLQGAGFTPEQIDRGVISGLEGNLIEAAEREFIGEEKLPRAVRVTSVGAYHLTVLASMFAYVDAMFVDTPILDDDARSCWEETHLITERLDRCSIFCSYLDSCWTEELDEVLPMHWPTMSADLRSEMDEIREKVS